MDTKERKYDPEYIQRKFDLYESLIDKVQTQEEFVYLLQYLERQPGMKGTIDMLKKEFKI